MLLQNVLIVICLVLMGYLSKHLYELSLQRRDLARAARLRDAVDWTKPPSRGRPKSRFSDFLKI